MAVTLTVSNTAAGANFADTLQGLSTGMSIGVVSNGIYAPLTSQVANTGHKDVYISHDGTNEITDVALYVAQFTGTYGGANTAALDFTALAAYGAVDSGSNANNADGLSRGLHIDMSWDVATASQFAYARETSGQKRIFGKSYTGLDGLSLATSFPLHVDAASYWDGSTEADASAPQTGKIGPSASTTLGNRGHYRLRFYLHSAATDGGYLQFDIVTAFSFTN